MALKLTLKPQERLIIGGAVITNGSSKTEFIVENNVPILRHKHILSVDDANTPAKRIYMVVQLMYVNGEKIEEYHKIYFDLIRDFISAVPRALPIIDLISEDIFQGRYYDALKTARELIKFEEEVLERANQCCESL